ncbi:DUF3857 domain-containing protein [Aggregicoccus sp. 17bor-14]|uniref:DUF3857 domain-containing protein n=1 Tax=Myxococcaceae TaxID=31 RepID=UPI00129D0A59|nr:MULTISPECIES: DUF3857 domain-containing protein [Myxococcaceae]MBF5046619.1 DUF3857 domain-containing protein [Simulacricoccus sp. 17bor-14]MRI92329.1 DUF3857 domain-containing protein [Aggregicoccus sp. 17bor-14]
MIFRALPALVLIALALPAQAARAPARQFAVAPAPAWVQPLPLPEAPAASPGSAAPQKGSAGLRFSLVDLQTRVGADGAQESYAHFARSFTSEGGVAEGSQLSFEFDPSYQHLTLHGVWRVRAGERRSIFDPSEVKVIQPERGLEAQMYDGSLSALLFLRDIRVGDTVEYAFTVSGNNPVFAGHFSRYVDARYGEPVAHWRYRLLWPHARPLFTKVHGQVQGGGKLEPRVTRTGAEDEYVWEQRKLEALQVDDGLPSWYAPFTELQLSDYADWEAVATWALPLFSPKPGDEAGLDAEAERLRAANATPEARLLAALRFAQDEVRYVGLELGPNTHQPHPPGEVLARRFGDCKDKALLLVALLRRLGIEAAPALVNTRARQAVDDLLPTHAAFDHAIVRAELDGHVYWLDATRTFERGALAQLQPPHLRRALVVRPGTRALEEIPRPVVKAPTVEVEEHYVARDRTKPATLTVTTRYSGPDADRQRDALSTGDLEEMSRTFLNYYARTDPDIRTLQPLEVKDDPAKNVLTMVERYSIENFWRTREHDFDADAISQELTTPKISSKRTMPFAVRYPRSVKMAIRLEAPEKLDVRAEKDSVEGPAFRVDYDLRAVGSNLLLDYQYRSTADAVPPEKTTAHLDAVRKVRDNLGFNITLRGAGAAGAAAVPEEDLGWEAYAWLGGVLVFTLGGLWILHVGPVNLWRSLRSRRRRKAFAQKFEEVKGSSAATALPIASVQALPAALSKLRCGCGALGGPPPSVAEPLFLGDQVVLSLKWFCTQCGCQRKAFYAIQDEQRAA